MGFHGEDGDGLDHNRPQDDFPEEPQEQKGQAVVKLKKGLPYSKREAKKEYDPKFGCLCAGIYFSLDGTCKYKFLLHGSLLS